jgi:hypothetical protein
MRSRLLCLACQIIPGYADSGFHPAGISIRQDCATQQAHARCFSGAIRSHQPINLAWCHLQVNPIHRAQAAVTSPELFGFNEEVQAWPH